MKFPSIADVAKELRDINSMAEDDCDVRLQVYPDSTWAVRWGDPGYDQDHLGYWGASSVPGKGRRFNSRDIAKELIGQARNQHAEDI